MLSPGMSRKSGITLPSRPVSGNFGATANTPGTGVAARLSGVGNIPGDGVATSPFTPAKPDDNGVNSGTGIYIIYYTIYTICTVLCLCYVLHIYTTYYILYTTIYRYIVYIKLHTIHILYSYTIYLYTIYYHILYTGTPQRRPSVSLIPGQSEKPAVFLTPEDHTGKNSFFSCIYSIVFVFIVNIL